MGDYTDGSGLQDGAKISSALVSELPHSFDIDTDIVKKDMADTTKRKVISALRSRGLFYLVETVRPTLADMTAACTKRARGYLFQRSMRA